MKNALASVLVLFNKGHVKVKLLRGALQIKGQSFKVDYWDKKMKKY